MSQTQVSAHRGGFAEGGVEENTLRAFARAMDLGVPEIELDVHVTKDGHLVVIHDEDIFRTTNAEDHVEVKDLTLEELKRYRIKTQNGEVLEDEEIPTLKEVLELIQEKNSSIKLNVELKTDVEPYPGIEDKAVDLIREYGFDDRVNFSSFNHDTLKKLKSKYPEYPIGLLYYENGLPANALEQARELGAASINTHDGTLIGMGEDGKRFVDDCHVNGIQVKTWTVNDVDRMKLLSSWRVDTIITNYPSRAKEVLEQQQQRQSILRQPDDPGNVIGGILRPGNRDRDQSDPTREQ